MSIWLPPKVSAELRASTLQHEADVVEQACRDATLDWWTVELQKIDPHLHLVKAKDDSTVPGMKPGYWHVLRVNPGAPVSLIVHEGPDGEFREPDSGLFESLRRNDLWNAEVHRDRARMRREAREAADRRRERERNARLEELRERVRAVTEVSVSMTSARPWTQSMGGRRG